MKYIVFIAFILFACEKETIPTSSAKPPIKTEVIEKPNPGLPYYEFQRTETYKNSRLIMIRYYYIIDCDRGEHHAYKYEESEWVYTTSNVNVTNRCLWNDTIGDTYK